MIDLRATDLRQYLYCPRVVYYSHVVPVARVETFKMKAGQAAEREHARLERRRSLRRYGLDAGTRRYSVSIASEALGISGIIDEVVDGPSGPVPIEVKLSEGGVAFGHRVQLAAYGMALEETTHVAVTFGFIHVVPRRQVFRIEFDTHLRATVVDVVRRIRAMVSDQRFPGPADRPAKCDGCELRSFCNDVT